MGCTASLQRITSWRAVRARSETGQGQGTDLGSLDADTRGRVPPGPTLGGSGAPPPRVSPGGAAPDLCLTLTRGRRLEERHPDTDGWMERRNGVQVMSGRERMGRT